MKWGDANPWLEQWRHVLREKPKLTEVEFRNLMLECFRASDQRLQNDKANISAGPVDPVGGVFSVLALPWIIFRWLGWRGRLARHHAEMDETVRVLRLEGHFET